MDCFQGQADVAPEELTSTTLLHCIAWQKSSDDPLDATLLVRLPPIRVAAIVPSLNKDQGAPGNYHRRGF